MGEHELYDKVGVRKLTRDTYYPFIEEQNKASRDVIITYTAKACSVCKDFMPEYHSLVKNVWIVLRGLDSKRVEGQRGVRPS